MLSGFLEKKIIEHLGIKPTPQQDDLIFDLAEFIVNKENRDIFLLKGYAGTGKTTVISALVNALAEFKTDTILLAPTGRAAKVFSNTAKSPAYTIHKKIFRAKSKNSAITKFTLDYNKHKNAVFIIDESSMISNDSRDKVVFGTGRLLDDLMKYVFSGTNCKIIFSGDTAQLPPVKMDISPALDKNTLELYGFEVQEYELTEVVRQSLDSGILFNATRLREMISERRTNVFPKFKLDGFNDIIRISGTDLIETISSAYDGVGLENTIVVTRSNKRANKYNQGIRQTILYKESQISREDLVMVVKNNYYWKDEYDQVDFIANGDIVHISNIKGFEEMYDYHFAKAEIFMPDYDAFLDVKLLIETLDLEAPSLSYDQYKEFFDKVSESYEDEKDRNKRFELILGDKHLNALQVKFAYAVTCHKAQGGQWHSVFIDQSYINQDMLNIDFLRWLYTAITRATDKVYLVNFKDDFFE
ncbi:MAG: AAA family ATPase [Bacteroidales bacterium]|nr:AAA family ATPase [Bacteroidales bacterium]